MKINPDFGYSWYLLGELYLKLGAGEKAEKHFPATGEATLSGVIVEANSNTGLANKVERFIFGGVLSN